jgi:hypothetical protein
MGNITWRASRFFAYFWSINMQFFQCLSCFSTTWKIVDVDLKYLLHFQKTELKEVFRKKLLGIEKSWRALREKQSIFLLFFQPFSFSTSNVYPIIRPMIIKTTQNLRNLISWNLNRNWIAKILKFRKVTVVWVYTENGKFLKSFGTESKEFWQKKSFINFDLDVIDLKKNRKRQGF